MAVSNTAVRATYPANGVADTFAIPFAFIPSEVSSQVKVYTQDGDETPVLQTEGALQDYVLDPAYDATTNPSGPANVIFNTPPANGLDVIVQREVPYTQVQTYINNGAFPAASHERALDRLVLQIQQVQDIASRALVVGATGGDGGINLPAFEVDSVLFTDGTVLSWRSEASFIGPQGDPTAMGAFGSTPNANGATITGNTLVLQPADSTNPGGVSILAQVFAGVKTFLNHLVRAAQSGITAFATGGQASATQLTKDINRVSVCATGGDSVKLPAGVLGMEVVVVNDGAASCDVYPATGESIDALGTDAAFALINGTNARFICVATGTWRSAQGGSGGSFVEADQTPTNGGTVTINDEDDWEVISVEGSGGPVTLADPDPFSITPTRVKKITLVGVSDTNTVTILSGTIMQTNGDVVLGLGYTHSWVFKPSSGLWIDLGGNI